MNWYWKCMLSAVVDPINAIIATIVVLAIGVFAYMKRHVKYNHKKNKME